MVSGSKWQSRFSLPQFDSETTTIQKWMDRLDTFILAEYGAIDDVCKRAILLTAIRDEALIAIENFEVAEKETFDHLRTGTTTIYDLNAPPADAVLPNDMILLSR